MSESAGSIVARDRRVLTMQGGDARRVLQGVVTSDVDRMAPDRLVYAALLTPQGKYLFDFFLFPEGEAVMIDVAADRAGALAQRLSMYCLRRDARVAGEAELEVALAWGAEPGRAEGTYVFADPRDPALGWRVYAPDVEAALGDIPRAEAQDYTALRVRHGVPESGVELVPEQTFILEAGLERLGGIDFRKGCYVGQEVTARMKHKATLRRGLVRVTVAGEAAPGTPVTTEGKPAGTLFTVADGTGLAELRLDRAGPGMQAGGARVDYTG